MKINYKVKLLTPAITASLGIIGKDIDIRMKLDGEGNPYFSAKHIKGILRERVRQFKRALGEEDKNFIEKYFGKEGNYIENNNGNQIRFSNLKLAEKKDEILNNRYGIKINRKTKTAEDNSLFNFEFVKNDLEFEGNLEVKDNISKEDLKFILASLFHLDYIGGLKSRGIGKVEVIIEKKKIENLDSLVNILKNKVKNKENKKLSSEYKKYSYKLKLEEPLVLAGREVGNYVEVRNSIQGSSIRGAMIAHFINQDNADLKDLIKISVSDAFEQYKNKKIVPLASIFKTKYKIKEKDVYKDKVSFDRISVPDESGTLIKLERASLNILSVNSNEISVEIDEKTKSAKDGQLFNTEYIESDKTFFGDIELPKEAIKLGEKCTIYLGKYRFKGFGKCSIEFSEYKEKQENSIKQRIEKLNKKIKNKDKDTNKIFITFDLCSDLILPCQSIYNTGNQFKELANLENEFKLELDRSFINISKLRGFNAINNIRKVDELVLNSGSVLTYSLEKKYFEKNSENYLEIFKEIENLGLGLRKREGFGRIKICSDREFLITYLENKNNVLNNENLKDKNLKDENYIMKLIREENFYEKSGLEKISLSQIEHFYNHLESKNYYFNSNYIDEFIRKQKDRAEKNKTFKKALKFYDYFQNIILPLGKDKQEENKEAMQLLKKYTRFKLGIEEIQRKLKENKEVK